MSFDNTGTKPILVEDKMIVRISKIQKIMEKNNITVYQKIGSTIWKFFINNLISIIIILLVIIILIYRYIEVQNRKKNKN